MVVSAPPAAHVVVLERGRSAGLSAGAAVPPSRIYLLFAAAPYFEAELRAAAAPEEDLAALRVPNLELLDSGGEAAGRTGVLASPAALDAQLDQLEQRPIEGRDILLIWLRAQWLTVDGQVELLCGDFEPADERSGRYPLRRLLDRLGRCPARTKLIFLDGGRLAHEPRLGIFAECAPQQIRPLIQGTGDRALWVFLSHSELQSAQDLPESRRSAFASWVGTGLRGQADRNQDRLVDLAELAEYVRDQQVARPAPARGRPALSDAAAALGRRARDAGHRLSVGDAGRPVCALRSERAAGRFAVAGLLDGGRQGQTAFGNTRGRNRRDPGAGRNAGRNPFGHGRADGGCAGRNRDRCGGSAAIAGSGHRHGDRQRPELLAKAWASYQTLADSPLQPRQRAPQLWHALHDRLKNLESACTEDGLPPEAPVVADLRRTVLQLEDLAAGRSPPRAGRWDLVCELARWAGGPEPEFSPHSLAMDGSVGLRSAASRCRPT